MYKIAFLSSTSGTNLQSFIDAIAEGRLKNVEISCFITNKADCGAAEKARKAGIKVFWIDPREKTREVYDEEVSATLDFFGVDLIVLGGWMRLFSEAFVDKYAGKIINIHPSLLPKYPGMDLDVHAAVIKAGEKESGMTIHVVDAGMDTGPILLQKKVTVDPGETPESLKAKVQAVEREWYPKVVQDFADGKL
jgi:phosphoribosylglycinamide formyltransferase-1